MSTFKLPESQKVYKRATDKQEKQRKLPAVVWKLLDLLEKELQVSSLAGHLNLSEGDVQAIIDECLKRKLVTISAPKELLYEEYSVGKQDVSPKLPVAKNISEEVGSDFSFMLDDDDSDTAAVDIDFDGEEFMLA